MNPVEAAAASARAVSNLGANFMSDPSMTARGRELGFEGIDFYFVGRAGVLGEIDADVATAALVFFNPETVHEAWQRSEGVLGRRATAIEFAACAANWADRHLGGDIAWDELHQLTRRIVDAAPNVLAPIFAGWMTLDEPSGIERRTVHAMNGLREFRMARHAAAVLANGIAIGDAVRHRQPTMVQMFGWQAGTPDDAVVARWHAAESLTDQLVGDAYAVLDEPDLDRFVELTISASRSIH